MPDDVPDYERLFRERFGMTPKEVSDFLMKKAVKLTCDRYEAEDLVHDFLVEKLLPGPGEDDS